MKEFLSRNRVQFEEIDVSTLDDPMGTLRKVTGGPMGTPTVVIGEAFRMGYDPGWMAERLGIPAS